jgi:tetraacyldisaccharide 4'-kinase
VRAARELVAMAGCDLVISDDGLQHLALHRDVEIAVLDGERRHGNGRCLPAGPLREPSGRLASVDMVVSNGAARRGEFAMALVPGPAVRLDDPSMRRPLGDFAGTAVHAVAGIGNPGRFFAMLAGMGIAVVEHPFTDHHAFTREDLDFGDSRPVLMTEKDAVKCRRFEGENRWYVPVVAELPDAFCARLERTLAAAGAVPPGGEA